MTQKPECFCKCGHPEPAMHATNCPVARTLYFKILKPDEFVQIYSDTLKELLTDLGDLAWRWHGKTSQIKADLDLMSAPICPRCYERDGTLTQTSEPRRLCIPCSREIEP